MANYRDSDLILRAIGPIVGGMQAGVLDALYCEFGNAAGTLEGNTEAGDVEWFARRLWEAEDDARIGRHWEQTIGDEERERYRRWARIVLRELPVLMGRMASRLRDQAAAIKTLLRAEWAAEKAKAPTRGPR